MKYSKDLLLSNINWLLKEQSKKVSDLEKAVFVSSGYFSRFRKTAKDASPNINILKNIADYFSVSLETLVFEDLTTVSEDEEIIIEFLSSLIEYTISQEIIWSFLKSPYLARDICLTELKPLFECPPDFNNQKYAHIKSPYGESSLCYMDGALFYFIKGDIKYVLLDNTKESDDCMSYFGELYYIEGNVCKPIIRTNPARSNSINEKIEELRNIVWKNVNKLKIDNNVRMLIKNFKV